ncbi:MAG: hypothetical protein ABUT20_35560, partial [Bacteroidota bacterium]
MNQTGNKTAPVSFIYQRKFLLTTGIVLAIVAAIFGIQAFSRDAGNNNNAINISNANANKPEDKAKVTPGVPAFDSATYTQKMVAMANGDSSGRWPVIRDIPTAGAIFPF